MQNTNKHGLSRTIPSEVRREVRKRCGFGCVVCGSAIYEYEHFAPEFKDATEHCADGIALLCPTDHTRKAKKLLSEEKYLKAIANPKAFETNKAYTEWETSNFAPTIILGNKIFTGGTSILKIDGELLLGFNAPEEEGAPPRLTARFFDQNQKEVFSIIDNQIQVHSDSFDVETEGENWIVRSKPYKVDLRIQLSPPDKIIIKQLNFKYKKWGLSAKDTDLSVLYDDKPSLIINGSAIIEGPCLYDLSGEGKIETKNMNITFINSEPKPIVFEWPLYLYVDTEDHTPIQDSKLAVLQGPNFLLLFTSEELAKQKGSELIPSNFKLKSLGQMGLIKLLEDVALPNGIDQAILDPDLDATSHLFQPIDLKKFIADNRKIMIDTALCPCRSGKLFKNCHGKQ